MALLTPGAARSVLTIDNNVATEIIQISAAQAANKEIQLSRTPTDPAKTILDIVGGTSQVNGSDFQVSGDILSWNGLALETLLAENDIVRIQYVI